MSEPHDADAWAVDEHRTKLLAWAAVRQGAPYIWGAKGPEHFDCSGFVVSGMLDVGLAPVDWLYSHNAARLFAALEPTTNPQPLDLCFWGQPGRVSHVMFLWHDGRVYGATGGNQSTTTVELAAHAGACVRFKSSSNYRPDFRGYRRLPTPKE